MNRRAFISKTALTALAAPFLPAALAKPLPKPKDTTWSCIALCRKGAPGIRTDATMHTDDVDNVMWFLEQFMNDEDFHLIEIYANGRLFMSQPCFTYRVGNKMDSNL